MSDPRACGTWDSAPPLTPIPSSAGGSRNKLLAWDFSLCQAEEGVDCQRHQGLGLLNCEQSGLPAAVLAVCK